LAITIILAVASMFCIIVVAVCRGYILKVFNEIDTVLDCIMAKEPILYLDKVGENRISKLAHKANRIVDMYVLEELQVKSEKETVQGFISDMSHQMKTPLSSISMYVDLLIEGNLSPTEQVEFLTRIKSGAVNLQWMMNSLIKMSRLEIGAIQLAPISQNIKQTIANSIESILGLASKKNIEIVAENLENKSLYHDKKWTQEAIINVLENAIKYSDIDSKIRVTVEPLPIYTKISITDYGKGIDKNDWHLIFKRFYRGHDTKATEGAGLGLYLANLVMEKQGGYVMVDSVLGEFTTFSLFLQNCKD